jgi:hypothetical protein
MRRWGCLILPLLLAGCGTVHLDVPEGTRVKLLEQDAPASRTVEQKVWFALWGATEVSDNHTATLIGENRLTEVRIQVKYTGWDVLLNTVLAVVGFTRRSVIVEGNGP